MKFIFEIRIKPGHTETEYVEAWQRASALMQKQPGAQGARLHRKVGEPEMLLAIASWESIEARDLAMKNLKNADEETRKIVDKHWEVGEITVLGNFDEPDWIVERSK